MYAFGEVTGLTMRKSIMEMTNFLVGSSDPRLVPEVVMHIPTMDRNPETRAILSDLSGGQCCLRS